MGLTAAERRRILRERRAKRLASNASDRLKKIAGLNGSEVTGTAVAEQEVSEQNGKDSKNESDLNESVGRNGSLDTEHTEGEFVLPDLSKLNVADPLHRNSSEEDNVIDDEIDETDMDKLMQNIFSKMEHSKQHPDDSSLPSLLPDDFMKTMSSMLKQSAKNGGQGQLPDLASKIQAESHESSVKSATQTKYENDMKRYTEYEITRINVYFTLFRFLAIIAIITIHVAGYTDYTASFENLRPSFQDNKHSFWSRFQFWSNGDMILRDARSSRFWTYFMTLEVIASMLYYSIRSRLPESSPQIITMLIGFIPSRFQGLAHTATRQFDVLLRFITDLAFVIVVMGLLTYFFEKNN
ncbi:hypothetical protein HII13_001087 [Brettanomyces bruxellensis]|nr:hypothetical protein HII13_001087 [Brettanomyces bruxellensis]